MTRRKEYQGTSWRIEPQSMSSNVWSDGWLDYLWEGTRKKDTTVPYARYWFMYNEPQTANDFIRYKDGDFADAYPGLAPFYPIQSPDLWLDPWLMQDYHGYWW